MRKPWLTWLISLPFALSLLFAWAWFNTNIARRNSSPSALGSSPRIWLSARTNIPGYIFVPEPVSDQVKKTLGTTNILSGTFVRNATETKDQTLKTKDSEVLGPRSLVSGLPRSPEPVSESVMKTLGTTNILSGTFYRNSEDRSQKSAIRIQC